MTNKTNVLLVIVDQWRWDCLGAAGHPVVQTPHLDVLARDGTLFSSAYSVVPSCIAARAGLMTGLHQRNHGRIGYQDRVPWEYPTTLGSVFSGAGYHTQVVGKMHVYPARNLIGFHNVVLHEGYLHWNRRRQPGLVADDDYLHDLRRHHGIDADHIDSGIGCNGYVVAPWPYDIMLHPTAWVTSQSIDFLRRRDTTKPFFLVASYHRPHPPLDPPQAYLDIYQNSELPSLMKGDWVGQEGLPNIKERTHFTDSPKMLDSIQVARARRAYYAQCTFIDHQLNRLIMALIEHEVYQDTHIIFVSDHGDMLFDHELEAKGLPYQGSAGVPLIIKPAGSSGYPGNLTVDAPVELRDILPTICDLTGVDVPENIDGQSLQPFLSGQILEWRQYLHGEHSGGSWSNHWLTDGKTKYVWYSQTGVEQLFNLEDDPTECHDLAGLHSSELAFWRQRMVTELTNRDEGFVRNGQLIAGRPAQAVISG